MRYLLALATIFIGLCVAINSPNSVCAECLLSNATSWILSSENKCSYLGAMNEFRRFSLQKNEMKIMMNFHGLLLLIIDEELPFDTQMSLVSNAMKIAPLRNCRQMPGDISAMTFMLRRYHSWRTCQETKLFDFTTSEFDFRNEWEK